TWRRSGSFTSTSREPPPTSLPAGSRPSGPCPCSPAPRSDRRWRRADFVPVFLSDVPHLFASRQLALDLAVLPLSPPAPPGLCSLGTSCDAARAAADSASLILAEINERMPRTHGHTAVPLSRVTAFTHSDRPLPEHPEDLPEAPEVGRIADLVAERVEDGAC